MPHDHCISVGTVRTRFWRLGETGSPIILLHGIGCSVLEWEHNIEALSLRHRVYAVDLLGFGLTDKPGDANYSLRQLAQFALDFMTALGLTQGHLAGNFLGGRLALLCANLAPQRILSLLLVDPAGMARRETLFEFRLASPGRQIILGQGLPARNTVTAEPWTSPRPSVSSGSTPMAD